MQDDSDEDGEDDEGSDEDEDENSHKYQSDLLYDEIINTKGIAKSGSANELTKNKAIDNRRSVASDLQRGVQKNEEYDDWYEEGKDNNGVINSKDKTKRRRNKSENSQEISDNKTSEEESDEEDGSDDEGSGDEEDEESEQDPNDHMEDLVNAHNHYQMDSKES